MATGLQQPCGSVAADPADALPHGPDFTRGARRVRGAVFRCAASRHRGVQGAGIAVGMIAKREESCPRIEADEAKIRRRSKVVECGGEDQIGDATKMMEKALMMIARPVPGPSGPTFVGAPVELRRVQVSPCRDHFPGVRKMVRVL